MFNRSNNNPLDEKVGTKRFTSTEQRNFRFQFSFHASFDKEQQKNEQRWNTVMTSGKRLE